MYTLTVTILLVYFKCIKLYTYIVWLIWFGKSHFANLLRVFYKQHSSLIILSNAMTSYPWTDTNHYSIVILIHKFGLSINCHLFLKQEAQFKLRRTNIALHTFKKHAYAKFNENRPFGLGVTVVKKVLSFVVKKSIKEIRTWHDSLKTVSTTETWGPLQLWRTKLRRLKYLQSKRFG